MIDFIMSHDQSSLTIQTYFFTRTKIKVNFLKTKIILIAELVVSII